MTQPNVLAIVVSVTALTSVARSDDDDFRVVTPANGREPVRPMRPDWCEPDHEVNRGCDDNCQHRTTKNALSELGSGRDLAVAKVAQLACDFPDSARVQRQIAYWRQDWINTTGLTELEDRAGLRAIVNADTKRKLQDELCARIKPTAPNESAQFEQQRAISIALGCEGTFSLAPRGVPWSHMTWLDRPDLPRSQIVTAAYVLACVPDDANPRYANCAGDVARLDRKQLEAEIAALGLNPLGRVRALEVFGVARARADAALASIKQNAALAQVTVAVAGAAFDSWEATAYRAHKKLFDLAYAIEDKASAIDPNELSRSPRSLGCTPLRQGLREYIVAQKPKTAKAVLVAATDAVAYPLLARLALCDAAEGRYTAAAAELQVLRSQHRYRHGAHLAAHWGAFDAALESKHAVDASAIPGVDRDDQDRAVKLAAFVSDNHTSRLRPLDEATADLATDRSGVIEQGKVSSVKTTKDGVVMTFAKEQWIAASWNCTTSKRIVAFQGNQAIYDRDCEPAGTHVETYQLEPRVFDDASSAERVRVGQIVKCVSANEKVGDAKRAFLMEIDAAGGRKAGTMLEYLGVPVQR
jgi:hypothetical protein